MLFLFPASVFTQKRLFVDVMSVLTSLNVLVKQINVKVITLEKRNIIKNELF